MNKTIERREKVKSTFFDLFSGDNFPAITEKNFFPVEKYCRYLELNRVQLDQLGVY